MLSDTIRAFRACDEGPEVLSDTWSWILSTHWEKLGFGLSPNKPCHPLFGVMQHYSVLILLSWVWSTLDRALGQRRDYHSAGPCHHPGRRNRIHLLQVN